MTKISKTDAQWREQLSEQEYQVTRQQGTERPFTGEYWDHTAKGTYRCKCCQSELFASDTKFDAHCGWPSFYDTLDKTGVTEIRDTSHGMIRIEVRCTNCDAHLGHVFPDGPDPTGQRYCINSVSLEFEDKK